MNPIQSRKPSSGDRIRDLVAELRKLQDIIDSHADRILDMEKALKTIEFFTIDPSSKQTARAALQRTEP